MSTRRKPDFWLLTDGSFFCPEGTRRGYVDMRGAVPVYRESPTAKEERAVLYAAMKWFVADGYRFEDEAEPRLHAAVERLLAARKKARRKS